LEACFLVLRDLVDQRGVDVWVLCMKCADSSRSIPLDVYFHH
jgi:hypothetical protein